MRRETPTFHSDTGKTRGLLIIFTRYPTPGLVKTRLIPSLGEHGSARLHRDMTRRMINTARTLPPDIAAELHCSGGTEAEILELFGPDMDLHFQSEGDIGKRMLNSFRSAADRGYRRVVLTGTDCPLITRETLIQAFDRLDSFDCVLGPSFDGGYYLVGMKHPHQELFSGISWGSANVLYETLAKADTCDLSTTLLKRLHDVDRPEDIPYWQAACSQAYHPISVIIPVLNEESTVTGTLNLLKQGTGIEVIVVDGGSHDRTVQRATSCGACIIHSPPGRARQMNLGARQARSESLLFLHADTHLPDGFDQCIRKALSDPGTVAGAFSLGFHHHADAMRLIAWGANLRSRHLQLPYGDQAIFIRKADFQASGGFPEIPIMEDAAFVMALKNKGRIITLPQKVVTSARRYTGLGIFRTWLINQCIVTGFLMGAYPEELARLYRTRRGIREWLSLLKGIVKRNLGIHINGADI